MNRGWHQGDSDDDDYIGYSRSSTTSLQSTLVQAAQRFESERRTETQTLRRQHDRKVTELQDQLRRKENELQTQIRDKEASVAAEKARADALEEDSARNRMKVAAERSCTASAMLASLYSAGVFVSAFR